MQRWCGKFRSYAISSTQNLQYLPPFRRLIRSIRQFEEPVAFPMNRSTFKPLFNSDTTRLQPRMVDLGFRRSFSPLLLDQRRHFSSKERKRKPVTPVTSKLKKTKMKCYSSFKLRFRVMNDGNIRRWRAGKRHNAHLKSKISIRRLRKPALVHPAYAKVMKKLNFCG